MQTQTFKRAIESQMEASLFQGKVLILYGPRQVGKTTLVKKLLQKHNGKYFLCEEPDILAALTNKTSTEMKRFLGGSQLIVLDEAQVVPNIGTALKLLVDQYPEMQIIATGSSSFDLANKVNEPLTGRNFEFHLYPLSVSELVENFSHIEAKRLLDERLIFGNYPEIVARPEIRNELLQKIANDYLYKDILSYGGIRKPQILKNILKALALQVGSQVSYSELARTVGASRETVMAYVEILEKAFVIFRLYPLTNSSRNETKHMHKIYFYDNGILNALIQNYNSPSLRSDIGALFENYFISEKIKQISYNRKQISYHFWRTKSGQEIDFIETYDGGTHHTAYECKWSKTKAKLPGSFIERYGETSLTVVSRDTIIDTLWTTVDSHD